MTMRWTVMLEDADRCVIMWSKKVLKGDIEVFLSSNSNSVLFAEGTKYIFDGEGRIRRLLRSKS